MCHFDDLAACVWLLMCMIRGKISPMCQSTNVMRILWHASRLLGTLPRFMNTPMISKELGIIKK